MWTRVEIKNNAKDFLRKYYLKAFIVCLILSFFTSSIGNNGVNSVDETTIAPPSIEQIVPTAPESITDLQDIQEELSGNMFFRGIINTFIKVPVKIIKFASPLIVAIVAIILSTLGYLIEVGSARFFLQGYKEDPKIGTVFSTFNIKEWANIVITNFLRNLYVFLWTLLFIIPGIIKSIEYSMVPYILAENSSVSASEAIKISKKITYGHKMDMFVLKLSFLGWDMLGILFFGVGHVFIRPYKEATYANLYMKLTKGNSNFIEAEIID